MATLTTLTQLPANIQGFYDRKLLERATETLVHDRFAQVRSLPANSGTKISFRRYNNLPIATVPLVEGVTGSGNQLSATDLNATIVQYGDFVTVTDMVDVHGLDNTIAEATDILGDQMAETLDAVFRDSIVPNLANKIFIAANEAATVATDIITVAAFKKAALQLKTQKAKPFTPMIDASTGVGTTALKPSFWCIASPKVVYDLMDQPGYVSAENYASTKTLADGEVGSVVSAGVRIVETNMAYCNVDGGNGAVDTFHTAIFGKDAYGIVNVRGKGNAGVIVKTAEQSGTSDPLNQRAATVGWKVSTVAKILNDAYAVSIVSASSQGDNA